VLPQQIPEQAHLPKERFHLLLADKSLSILASQAASPPATERQRWAYFLGAISPDALFYDLPFFRLSFLGTALHRLEGLSSLKFLSSVLNDCTKELTPEAGWWFLGVAGHFLADGFWHPIIEKISESGCCFYEGFSLSKRECHHWLESELEGFWLHRAGPPDAYRLLLKGFAGRTRMREECIRCFRMILMRLGLTEVPDAKQMDRCFSWQAFFLRQFSLPIWSKMRNLLLQFSATRFYATLIVPEKTSMSPFSTPRNQGADDLEDLYNHAFTDQWMARSATFVTTHLRLLSAQL
jgi:hypothetical protein